jgi:TRAP-type C4-dicarboxylate transport system permease small subunit
MERIGKFALRCLENGMAAILMLMLLIVFVNVVLRYAFNSGIDVSEEVVRYLFVWLTFIAAITACGDNSHVNAGALVGILPGFPKLAIGLLSRLLIVFCCVLLAYSSWRHAGMNWRNFAPVSGLPTALLFVAGAFGGLGMAIATFRDAIRLILSYNPDKKGET